MATASKHSCARERQSSSKDVAISVLKAQHDLCDSIGRLAHPHWLKEPLAQGTPCWHAEQSWKRKSRKPKPPSSLGRRLNGPRTSRGSRRSGHSLSLLRGLGATRVPQTPRCSLPLLPLDLRKLQTPGHSPLLVTPDARKPQTPRCTLQLQASSSTKLWWARERGGKKGMRGWIRWMRLVQLPEGL